MTAVDEPEEVRVVRTTPELFEVVRAEPVVGRVFDATEDQATVVVLSHGLWLRRFGGDRSAVGRTIELDSVSYIIVGVLPPSFRFPDRDVDAWIPLRLDADARAARSVFWLQAVGRLKAGASLAEAQQEMSAIASRLEAEHAQDRDLGVTLVGLRDDIARPFRAAILMLTAAVVGVLLIACVNVAAMLTARGAGRRREVAIRSALGGSRRRVARQLLTEALVLFVAGGLLGVALGSALLGVLVRLAPPSLAWLGDASLDATMLAVALGLSALTGLIFGVLPSWTTGGADVIEVMAGVRGSSRGSLSQRFRRTLVVSQIAIATVVVSAASLMMTSLVHAERVDLGFDVSRVVTARVQLPSLRYPDPAARQQFFDRLLQRAQALPGVIGAAAATSVLLGRLPNSASFTIEGRSELISKPLTFDAVTPDFFRVLGIPLRRGRYFSDGDRADGLRVAIINETTARTHWPDQDPLGKRFKFGEVSEEAPWLTVVGVVADTRRAGVDHPVFTESYQPHTQIPQSMTVLVRTGGDEAQLASALRAAVRELDAGLAVSRIAPLERLVDEQIAARRFNTWLLTAFGAAAIALMAIGVYGLLAYLVALRRHEVAVRLSVGATPRQVLGLVARHVAVVAGIGLTLGVAGALTTAAAMQGLLFAITPWDPLSQAVTFFALGIVVVAAAWIPARRAMRVEPAAVLRAE